jgi:hypothetical protein
MGRRSGRQDGRSTGRPKESRGPSGKRLVGHRPLLTRSGRLTLASQEVWRSRMPAGGPLKRRGGSCTRHPGPLDGLLRSAPPRASCPRVGSRGRAPASCRSSPGVAAGDRWPGSASPVRPHSPLGRARPGRRRLRSASAALRLRLRRAAPRVGSRSSSASLAFCGPAARRVARVEGAFLARASPASCLRRLRGRRAQVGRPPALPDPRTA